MMSHEECIEYIKQFDCNVIALLDENEEHGIHLQFDSKYCRYLGTLSEGWWVVPNYIGDNLINLHKQLNT